MKNNKHIIFVGNPVPSSVTDSRRVLNFNTADNIAQNTVIKGLYQHYGDKLTVVSISPTKKPEELDLGYGVRAITAACSNRHRILFYLTITVNYTKIIYKLLRQKQRENTVIITAGPYVYMALPVMIAKWAYKVKWVPFLIGAIEVPEVKFPYSLISKLSRWTVRQADGAITYVAKSVTDYMPGKPLVEIFYLIDDDLMEIYQSPNHVKPKKITITYTGALTTIYNIDMVIEVIKNTGNKYHWVFAGIGQYADKIQELSVSNTYDVDYLGSVSNKESINLQKSSHILLCLKGGDQSSISEYYSKYAASGKLVEYLCSGTPILAGDIPAFSEELKKYMTCEKNQDPGHIEKDIANIVANYDELMSMAKKGQAYAYGHLTASHQNKKVHEFLEEI